MAIEATTRIHTGKAPIPGMASAISPGSSAHLCPRIRNRTKAVPTSSTHCTGGAITVQNDKTSETAATANARPSRVREGRFKGASESAGDSTSILSVGIGLCSLRGFNRAGYDHPTAAEEAQPAAGSGGDLF